MGCVRDRWKGYGREMLKVTMRIKSNYRDGAGMRGEGKGTESVSDAVEKFRR